MVKMKLIIIATVLFAMKILEPKHCESYRILGVFPLTTRSHFMMYEAVMKGLARKGHQVDVISGLPQKKPLPNYTDIIVLPSLLRGPPNVTHDNILEVSSSIVAVTAYLAGNSVCPLLGNPEVQEFIRNPPRDPPYDLVMVPFLAAHCWIAVGYYMKVPTIGVSSSALYPWMNAIVANPDNLAFVPNNLLDFIAPMTFWQRVWNTVHTAYDYYVFKYVTNAQNAVLKKHFGEDAPSVRELERYLSLILTNSHPALNGPKPVAPAVIEVGGLHVQDDGPELTHELIKWMDESTDGFVYFTFGSMVRIESFPESTIRALYKSLGKIAPMRVLVKIIEVEKLPAGIPENFRTFQWISQYKVLKHKNAKAFITHGGLMGTLEALYCAVPMIGIPLFVDQFTNVRLYVSKNMAVQVNHDNITEETMDEALNAVLYNPIYKNSILDVSAKFTDRPMSAMDTATWWVEYVIRHGGSGLRSPAMDLTWWQIELFDVYAFLLLIAASAIIIIIVTVRCLIAKFFLTRSSKVILSKDVKKMKEH